MWKTASDFTSANLVVRRRKKGEYQCHITLRIPFFIPAVHAIAQTDLVLTVPRTLTKMTKRITSLRMIEPPRELRPFPYFMSWHPRLTNEPAQAWLREQVRVAAQSIRGRLRAG
jgi:DNA-binding transcriptional LysR family regulator